MVSIRLKRLGAKKRPYYRIVVMDNRASRSSETIDEIGTYHPIEAAERQVTLDQDKAKAWLNKGAQPSATVKRIFNKQGISVTRESQN